MQSDDLIRSVLTESRTIAVVGISANVARPSYGVARFLQARGHRIVPVNPGLAGKVLFGETVYALGDRRAAGDTILGVIAHGALALGLVAVALAPGGRANLEAWLFGETVYARVGDIPFAVDMIDVFRSSDAVPALVEEVLAMSPLPRSLWLQLGVIAPEAAAKAEAAGMRVVMDRCPAIEYGRLGL